MSDPEIKKRKEQLKKLEDELAAIKARIKSKRYELKRTAQIPVGSSGVKWVRRRMRKLGWEDKILIESKGLDKEEYDLYDIYISEEVSEEDGWEFINSISNKQNAFETLTKFLLEEVESKGEICSGFGLKHKIWVLEGRELEAFVTLTDNKIGSKYLNDGWSGVEEGIKQAKKLSEHPLKAWNPDEVMKEKWSSEKKTNAIKIMRRILDYSFEEDVTAEESLIALSLEDEGFPKEYEDLKFYFEEKALRWEEAFEPYLRGCE